TCPDPRRWYPVPANGPAFVNTKAVAPSDQQKIRDYTLTAMTWLKGKTGYEVRDFLVFAYTNIAEYAQYFGISFEEATRRSQGGEDCGFNQLQVQLGGIGSVGKQQMYHTYFH